MMTRLIFLTCLVSYPFLAARAQNLTAGRSVITDPAVSRRCEALTKKRQAKIEYRQRVQDLLERNLKIQQISPQNRKVALNKLRQTQRALKVELELSADRIQTLEEVIVRKGCPGIVL